MVGCIIGSGVFRTPAAIAKEMGSPMLVLAFWLAGGFLSLFGALAYAELGTMFPRSGGIYVYLNRGFGGPVSFVFGWTYMLLAKPLAAAAISMVFAEHLNQLLGVAWDPRIATCVLLVGLTALNTPGTRLGAGVAIVLTALKVLALAGIVGLGLVLFQGNSANFAATPAPRSILSAVAPVMAAVLWTYDGWSDVAAVSGEVKEPQRTLPRILLAGTMAVTLLYLAVNAVYLWLVPLSEMRTVSTVAPLVMERLVGPIGGTVVTVMILVSTLGASHGSILTGARVTWAQSRDGLLFRFLGRVHPTFGTPDVSLWVQAALSCVAAVFLGTFERLAGGFVFTMWIFYALAVAAVILLRIRRPDLERPYRCWGYPVLPILFVAAAVAVTVLSILDSPSTTLPWLGVLLAGAPVYYLWRRISGSSG